jgi:Glycosyltransferase (GlcNAc)
MPLEPAQTIFVSIIAYRVSSTAIRSCRVQLLATDVEPYIYMMTLSSSTRRPQCVPQEPECHATLASLFAAASESHRVFAGVCEQRLLPAGSSEDCLPEQLPAELRSHVSSQALLLCLDTLGACCLPGPCACRSGADAPNECYRRGRPHLGARAGVKAVQQGGILDAGRRPQQVRYCAWRLPDMLTGGFSMSARTDGEPGC